jgi:hypothetical protein
MRLPRPFQVLAMTPAIYVVARYGSAEATAERQGDCHASLAMTGGKRLTMTGGKGVRTKRGGGDKPRPKNRRRRVDLLSLLVPV